MRAYFKVANLAKDKDGNPDYAGVKITFNDDDTKDTIYSTPEQKEKLIQSIADFFPCCNGDVILISGEEYEALYGKDDDNDN